MKASDRAKTMGERTAERSKRRASAGGGLSTLNLPEGVDLFKVEKADTFEFDVLPYRVSVDNHPEVSKGELWYERTYLAHRNIGPEQRFIICPRTIGKSCPICEEYQRLKKDPDADKEVVDGLKAKERELFNILLVGEDSPKILDMSTFNFGQLLEQEIREGDTDNASFAELAGGKTLKVRFSEEYFGGKKGGTPFFQASRIDFVDRSDDFGDDVLEAVVDLDLAMIIPTYEEIEQMMSGERRPAGKASEKEEDKPAARGIRRGAKPAVEETVPDEDTGPAECEACAGTGKNPKGKPCPVCEGQGTIGEESGEEAGEPEETAEEDCVACEGRGKTSRGGKCPICKGSGKVAADTPEDVPEDVPEDKPAARGIRRGAAKPAAEEAKPAGRRVMRR